MKMQMAAAASLSVATAKSESATSESDIEKIVEVVRATGPARAEGGDGWRTHILWVDDRPREQYIRAPSVRSHGHSLYVGPVGPMMHSRDWRKIDTRPLSQTWNAGKDLVRGTCCLTGCVIKAIRRHSSSMPRQNAPEHKRETRDHGGQGCTNNAQELFEMVTKAVASSQTA